MITQEQANAIAEREYPMGSRTMVYADKRHGKVIQAIEYHFEKERAAYAKCLMDMNPLIEAATEMREFITCENQTDGATPRCCDSCWGMIAWDTALSNLTKNIEP